MRGRSKLLIFINICLIAFAAFFTLNLSAQVASDGDFRSKTTGDWSSVSTWQSRSGGTWSDATSAPGQNNNVYIQNGHTITLDGSSLCHNLNVNSNSVLEFVSNTLSVYGKLRGYSDTAGAVIDEGADGSFYSDQTSGTVSNPVMTSSGGLLKFVGSSRTILETGEWGATGPANIIAEFDLDNTSQVGSLNAIFRPESLIFTTGTITTTERMGCGGNNGNIISIKNGAKVISSKSGTNSSNQVFSRANTASSYELNIEQGGILELTGETPTIDVQVFTNQGEIIYSRSELPGPGNQTLVQPGAGNGVSMESYYYLTLKGSGNKINTSTLIIQQNGKVTINDNSPFFINGTGGSISYGSNATLEIDCLDTYYDLNGDTDADVWPGSNGPENVSVLANNLRLNDASFDRTIPGELKLDGGILRVRDDAQLTFATGSTIIRNNNGELKELTGDVVFNNGVNIEIGYNCDSGDEFPAGESVDFGTLTINNGATYTLGNGSRTIDDLDFNSGKLVLNQWYFTVNNSITGYSTSNYLITADAGGWLRRPVGSSNVVFPIGPSASLYHPVTIADDSGSPDGQFSVNVTSDYPSCATDNTKSVQSVWDISSTASAPNCTVSLDYSGATIGSNYDSGNGKILHCGTSPSLHGSVSDDVATASDITNFSPFGVTSDLTLSVDLLSFDATHKDRNNLLTWQVANEWNMDRYKVERSAYGRDFEPIGKVGSKGEGFESKSYSFIDKKPLQGSNYYRLRMLDADGRIYFSDIARVYVGKFDAGKNLVVFPTEVRKGSAVNIQTDFEIPTNGLDIRIYDMNGRLVVSDRMLSDQHQLRLDKAFISGLYQLVAIDKNTLYKQRFFVID